MSQSIGSESENPHLRDYRSDLNGESGGGGESWMHENTDEEDTSFEDERPVVDDFSDEELQQNDDRLQEQQQQKQKQSGFLETDCGSMTVRALIGLGIAGLGGTLVADVFGMFYVDCFLRAYKLPMRVFGIGSAIFAVINTANDVAGAYLLDWYCASSGSKQQHNNNKREDLVGLSGCLFALSALLPFFRWGPRNSSSSSNHGRRTQSGASAFWDGLHFVGSLSIYDTFFSFNCILQGSIVSDNHSMTENQRIWFFALKDMVGILAPLVVTKIGLSLFDVSDLKLFRIYVVILVVVSSLLCFWGQALIHQTKVAPTTKTKTTPSTTVSKLLPAFLRGASNSSSGYSKVNHEANHNEGGSGSSISSKKNYQDEVSGEVAETNAESESSNSSGKKLGFWTVLSDFAAHPNFRYWIGMEMLMEGQNTFMGNFQKTFVDQLLRNENDNNAIGDDDGRWSNAACDWMLALLDPSTQIVGLLLFLPIKRYGYAVLYKVVFVTNICMASALLLSNGIDNTNNINALPIAAFLFLSIVLSNAMAGAGFGLAMCDMVLEMKHSHSVTQGRKNPPSLAGLFMGVNALFCKPAESVLPILAASFLGDGYNTDEDKSNGNDEDEDGSDIGAASMDARVVLYRLLVLPPLVCSLLQLILWSKYSLVPKKTERLRAELEEHEQQQKQQQQSQRPDAYRDGALDGASDERLTDIYAHSVIEMNQLG